MVCLGVLIMRRTNPDAPRSFRTPWVPVVPILGIATCLVMMVSLPIETWIRLYIWLVAGLLIYYFYGQKKSKLRQEASGALPKSLTLTQLLIAIVSPVIVFYAVIFFFYPDAFAIGRF
jgi:APA family basic amino acid/polyamine antiporter